MCCVIGYTGHDMSADKFKEYLMRTVSRGPDDQRVVEGPFGLMGFGRLAIMGLTPEGMQPFYRGADCVVCNGELYGFRFEKEILKRRGYKFTSDCDCEILLPLYYEYGLDMFRHMDAEFALILYDSRKDRLIAARDPIGIRPLFYGYSKSSHKIAFASEMQNLIGWCDDIRPFPIGSYYCDGRFVRYEDIADVPAPMQDDMDTVLTNIREKLIAGVEKRLDADAPVGFLLSGGLDSSLLSSLSSQVLRERGETLHTFSVDYWDNDRYFRKSHFQPTSDPAYIRAMERYLGCQHHWTVLDTPALAEALYAAVDARDLPGMVDVDSSLLLFCGEIRKEVTVALSGECADELFGGYPWYRDADVRRVNGFPWAQSTAYRAKFLRPELAEKIDAQAYVQDAYERTIRAAEKLPEDSPLESRMREMMKLNLNWFMQTLLDRKDRMSMYNSLEVRVPFCDYRIAEYLYNVPWEYKDWNGYEKGLLRTAMQDVLPPEVLWRKKSPYPKTHNPSYLRAVSEMLRKVLDAPDAPVLQIVRREMLEQLLDSEESVQWYGQLMTRPQIMAYFVQMDYWMRKYQVKVVF